MVAFGQKLEQGLEVKLNGEQLKKINQVIDMSGLLSFDDYYHRVATWEKISNPTL